MGLCSSTASAVKEAPARAPELERAPEQDKTQDKTKVHPAEPLPAPIDDDPDPPIAESIAESIEDSAPAKSAARVRAAGPPVATLESAVARREREEEEAKAMLLGMKERWQARRTRRDQKRSILPTRPCRTLSCTFLRCDIPCECPATLVVPSNRRRCPQGDPFQAQGSTKERPARARPARAGLGCQ